MKEQSQFTITRRKIEPIPSDHPEAWAYDAAVRHVSETMPEWVFTITDERGYSVVTSALADVPDEDLITHAKPIFAARFPR